MGLQELESLYTTSILIVTSAKLSKYPLNKLSKTICSSKNNMNSKRRSKDKIIST
jgi:hypothetical protein